MVSENRKPVSGNSAKKHAHLLGFGLDNHDGHVRVTRGENFHLFGGSQETHEQMQEQVIKLNEKLNHRGKRLEDVSHEELTDIAHELGVKILPEENSEK
ncbi:MAG: hypothetical protein GX629_07555 [Phycisphaerae bacterium]|jgi:hypothetical protein|nr:hypothetical protein [Phycisphaerae bacterium]